MKQIFKLQIQGILAKIVFVLLCAFGSFSVHAQTEIATAKTYLNANATKEKLSVADIAEMSVSSAYLSPTTGWYHLYFNQTYQSVEVYNGLLGVTLNNGQVGYVANNFVANLASKVPPGELKTLVNPVQALQKAATGVGLTASGITQITEVSSTTLPNGVINKASYLDPAISNDKIDVKLYWFPIEENDEGKITAKVVLTWNVRIMTKNGQNIWNVQIDALSGNVIKTFDDVIHCNFGTPEHTKAPHVCLDNKVPNLPNSKMLLGNTYNVFDYPLEAPTFGARTVVTSPYTKFVPTGTGPGTTNGWHNDGTTDFTNTRGNNAWAKEDLAADNEVTIGASPSSATLDFNYTYSQTTGSAATNLNAAITNMFYWNNVMHDILWKYGFDEPGGNYQKDNMARGGLGNDFVFADAQDGSGTNNANFSPNVDGGNGRMQMFIFSNGGSPAYQPDSDFDNGVIAHEYGHGWSTRLTGGPANSSCLQNAEQGGEGWSDYAALMTTTDWSTLTPTVASANIPRGIGTYVLGQLTTGLGIRTFRYSYDKTTYNNTITYARVADLAIPHGVGSIWAAVLWDMTWEIILQDNQIVNNIYNVPANIADYKGNVAALKLVNEGLRLQPCSPSFVQSRDAILQADQMLFGGRYRCAISKAFARRGLGAFASTGASTNDRNVTEDFTPISGPVLSSPNTDAACSNSPFTYTATTGTAGTFAFAWTRAVVSGISNPAGSATSATINETLINTTNTPITVTYFFTISPDACGGTPAQQPVSVVVNPVIVPTVATYSICQNGTVPVGDGLVVPPALGNTVNGTLVSGTAYVRGIGNNATVYSAGNSVFFKTYTFVAPTSGPVTIETTAATLTPGTTDDTYLTLYQTAFTPATPAVNFLRGDDDSGLGFLSSLTHTLVAGTTYIIVVSTFTTGQTGTFTLRAGINVFPDVNNWFTTPTGGVAIFTGDVFNPVGVAGSGVPNTATVSSTPFYVATGANPTCRAITTFNIVAPTPGAVGPDATVCSGTNAGTLTLTGHTGSILRWESSIDNFVTIVTIANTTTMQPYLNLTQTTKYRAVVQLGTCASANSSPATITVSSGTVAGTVTADATVCSGSNAGTLTLAGHTGSILRWESSIDNFVTPVTIANATTTQSYSNLTQTTKYRAVVQNGSCTSANSIPATITVNSGTVAGAVSPDATVCSGSNAGTLTLSGHTGGILRWESSIDNFVTPVVIANTTTSHAYLNLTQTTKYRAVVQNGICAAANSTPATITTSVGITVAGSVAPNASVCAGTNAGTLTLSGHLGTVVSWESSVDNFTTVVAIANTTTTQPYSNLTQTTKFRAIVLGTPCGATLLPAGQGYSSAATITVNPIPIVTASADQTICVGSSASLTATCVLQTVTTNLSGASEVPANASTATGNVTGNFNPSTNQLNLTITFNGLTANASAGHIHSGSVGVNGPVIIPFTVPASTSGTFNYSGVVTASQATALLAGNTYVNIHNASFPGGEVRGQLNVACVANTYVWNPGALSGQTVSVSPSLTTIYTVTASNSTTTCSSTATTTVTVLTPAAPVATGASIVLGGSVTLTATGCTGAGFVLKWYETVGDVAVTMPVSPTVDKQYYAKCEQTVGAVVCLSPKSNDVTVTVTGPAATVVFVNQANAAAPIQNGLTWATAYSNLQTALVAAPTGTEIWVAQGMYKPTSTISKTISFSIPSGAVVYGGFVGTETLLTQRNFNTYPTILSGEIGTIANPQDNSFHVVLFNSASNTTRLDGFTIRDGNSNYTVPVNPILPGSSLLPVSVNDGGGIAMDNGSSPMIANCKIINNKGNFGGGVFATNGSNPTFMNCMIMGNESTFGGGAYHLGSNAVYKNVLFSGNKATGGAVYNNVSSPTFTNVTIAGNGGYNGAVFNSSSSPVIKNAIIFGNILPFNDTQSITTNSIVEGGYPGIGNLNLNPQFVSMTPSGLSPTLAGDNSVINTSPAIDGGDNGTITLTDKDLVGNLRRFNGRIVDMGAYEFQGNRVGGTIISIISGNWEDGTTWDIGRQPLAGDSVIINDNHNVTVNSTGTSKDVKIKTNAKIIYSLTLSKSQLGY